MYDDDIDFSWNWFLRNFGVLVMCDSEGLWFNLTMLFNIVCVESDELTMVF